jgi:hypothetical protein
VNTISLAILWAIAGLNPGDHGLRGPLEAHTRVAMSKAGALIESPAHHSPFGAPVGGNVRASLWEEDDSVEDDLLHDAHALATIDAARPEAGAVSLARSSDGDAAARSRRIPLRC